MASAPLLSSGGAAQPTACAAPTLAPPAGPLCGTDTTFVVNGDSVTVNAFLGIPYAVPTTNDDNAGRWQPPTPFPTWTAPRQATAFSEICPVWTLISSRVLLVRCPVAIPFSGRTQRCERSSGMQDSESRLSPT